MTMGLKRVLGPLVRLEIANSLGYGCNHVCCACRSVCGARVGDLKERSLSGG